MDWLSGEIAAFLQVVFIDVVLAGDNAIVVGMAAAGVDRSIRRKVIFWGIGGAVILRVMFAVIATQLLAITGLTLAGGILLLWVTWKMYREIRRDAKAEKEALESAERAMDADEANDGAVVGPSKTFGQAMLQIILADVSMSLDNVLAVAGAAQEHVWVLILGLLLSVGLMGAAATLIANMLARFRWIAWLGLAVILYVAVNMILEGSAEVACLDAVNAETCAEQPLDAIKASLFGS